VNLPSHLRKYIIEQDYQKYTPVNQACWRYVMRQLKAYLSKHAHECYLEGLEKTGVEIEKIPRIEEISKKLEKFGWRALPVSGFIPPAAFMELQSLGVLPIACEMRTLDHLMYTPAPDIVHEAAGHAPILVHPEFANYLREYAQIARKAIISKEDLDLYEAIRELSDLKENPDSSVQQINYAQANLDRISESMSHLSEAGELSRMNWWTAEYGLIGDPKNPKIFGAGLLSSVGEAKWCLSKNVKKIPLSLDCIKTGYDITEPQPQLFVTPDFKTLSQILEQLSSRMAFRIGGLEGIEKAIKAASINTVELDSGIQISGQVSEVLSRNNEPIYIRLNGACQLSYAGQQLPGHDKKYHSQGFGTAIGKFTTDTKDKTTLLFESGVKVTGKLADSIGKEGKVLLMSFADCTVTYQDRVLFEPSWGTYDLAIGSKVTSVFGGPADREAYGETHDFKVSRIPRPQFNAEQLLMQKQYQDLRRLRETAAGSDISPQLKPLSALHLKNFPEDWLFYVEVYELAVTRLKDSQFENEMKMKLAEIAKANPSKKISIEDGLAIASQI
jgi:phenylalanine-4-hydroxylase